MYGILDDICDEYIPVVDSLERDSDAIDVQVLIKDAHEQPDMLQYGARVGSHESGRGRIMKVGGGRRACDV